MPTTQTVLAAQLYTLRQFTQTAADFAKTLHKCKQIGYDAVQVSGIGPSITWKEVAKILRDEGLICCATHVAYDKMLKEPSQVIDDHKTIDCKYTAIGMMPDRYMTGDGFHAFAREASEVAKRLKAGGLTLGYHNHSFELQRFDGKVGLDIIYDESDPALTAEIDTYWIQHGGGDPAAWIRKVKGRSPLVHLKDMAVGENVTASNNLKRSADESDAAFAARQAAVRKKGPIMAEVGEGNLNWPAVLDACRYAGSEWWIIEQDICQRDAFESLAISLKNLRAMGVK